MLALWGQRELLVLKELQGLLEPEGLQGHRAMKEQLALQAALGPVGRRGGLANQEQLGQTGTLDLQALKVQSVLWARREMWALWGLPALKATRALWETLAVEVQSALLEQKARRVSVAIQEFKAAGDRQAQQEQKEQQDLLVAMVTLEMLGLQETLEALENRVSMAHQDQLVRLVIPACQQIAPHH